MGAASKATIFRDCEEGELLHWLLSKQWDVLAEHFVDLEDKMTHEQKKALLLERFVLPFQRSPSRRTKARPSLTDQLVPGSRRSIRVLFDRILPRSSSPFFFVFISCVVGFCARILLAACLGTSRLVHFSLFSPAWLLCLCQDQAVVCDSKNENMHHQATIHPQLP